MINAITNDRRVKTIDAIVHSSSFRVLRLSDSLPGINYPYKFCKFPKNIFNIIIYDYQFPQEGTGVG
jgi:hypothetical protein